MAVASACNCGPAPTIAIINPTNGATVPLGTDPHQSVTVDFTTTNFTVQATCNGAGSCGQVYVFIDDAGCNPIGQDYNAIAVASPATAQFASCQNPTGSHALSLELHNEDGSPVKASNGQTVSALVQITTQ
jgi:Na+-transporting NADH:ubiquinone oxidoreductase subunit NqrF